MYDEELESDLEDKIKMTAWVPKDLHKKLKRKAVDNEVTVTDILIDLIEKYLKKEK